MTTQYQQAQQALITQIFENVQAQYGRLDLREVEQEMIRYGLQPDLSQVPAPRLYGDDEPDTQRGQS